MPPGFIEPPEVAIGLRKRVVKTVGVGRQLEGLVEGFDRLLGFPLGDGDLPQALVRRRRLGIDGQSLLEARTGGFELAELDV